MIDRSKSVPPLLKHLRNKYQKDENYWVEAKTFLEEYNQEKAVEIAAKMDTYLTSDSFHVVVFNQCKWQYDYTYHCPNEKSQIIGVWNTAGCNAFVYRSRKGNETTKEDYDDLRDRVMKCREGILTFPHTVSLQSVIQKQLIDPHLVRGDGLISLIDDGCNSFVEVANSERIRGPGYWDGVVMDLQVTTIDENLRRKTLLVSVP